MIVSLRENMLIFEDHYNHFFQRKKKLKLLYSNKPFMTFIIGKNSWNHYSLGMISYYLL